MSKCALPTFSIPFSLPSIDISLPIPDFDLSFSFDLFCPLD